MTLHANVELPVGGQMRRIYDRLPNQIRIPGSSRLNVVAPRTVATLAIDSCREFLWKYRLAARPVAAGR